MARHGRRLKGAKTGAFADVTAENNLYDLLFSMKLGFANIFGRQVVLVVVCFLCTFVASARVTKGITGARDLGVPFEGTPGELNAITDVHGVEVGHTTLVEGEGKLVVGEGPVRTGVTAILPLGKDNSNTAVPAAVFSFNGNGEMTGSEWVEESG